MVQLRSRSRSFDGHLPLQGGDLFVLRQHQQEALDFLTELRGRGESSALLTHATGAGKTVIALADARGLGLRTLYMVNTQHLVRQAVEAVRRDWPGVGAATYHGGRALRRPCAADAWRRLAHTEAYRRGPARHRASRRGALSACAGTSFTEPVMDLIAVG